MKVKKRNGNLEKYDLKKIRHAIERAFEDIYGPETYTDDMQVNINSLTSATEVQIGNVDVADVEDIQDAVEDVLMLNGYYEVAKEYIRYRYLHELRRNEREQEKFYDSIGEKLKATNVQNQNANVDEKSFGGRMGEACSELTRHYALKNCLSEMARNNHLNNEIYEHDLDHYPTGDHNCLSIPFDKLLANGFNTRQTDVRPANSVNTAFQLVAVIFQLQSLMQFGGVSATHLDWTMVPYIRKSFLKHFKDGMLWWCKSCDDNDKYAKFLHEVEDGLWPDTLSIEDERYKAYDMAYQYAVEMTKKETYQAVEGMYHNLDY